MLIILTSHPIQYQVPLWRALSDAGVSLEVWFLCSHGIRPTRDAEFGSSFAWDLPMLEGYAHRFLEVPNAHLRKPVTMRLHRSLRPLFLETGATHLWVEGWRFPAFWQAVSQANTAGLQVWCRGESNDLAPKPPFPKRWIKRVLLRWLFRKVDAFLCIGSANRRLYLQYGVPAARLQSAPYCVDNDRFSRQCAELQGTRSTLRRNWNIPPGSFCVLFAGKLIAKKRPLDLVAALELLSSENTSRAFHLLIVGSGELKEAIRSRCSIAYEAGVTHSAASAAKVPVSFTGFLNQTEICRAYVAADCLVLPSDTGETWGLVVNEAMACGTPCISSDACGSAEDLVAPVDPALRYRCGDIQALASALRKISVAAPSPELIKRVVDEHHLCVTVDTVNALFARVPED